MNIRDWPLNQIMQLPDNCFGRRWPISLSQESYNDTEFFVISEAALADRCVIWFLALWSQAPGDTDFRVTLSLGDHLPANWAEFEQFEPLFSAIRDADGYVSAFILRADLPLIINHMRMPVAAQGRRIVGMFTSNAESLTACSALVVVSSVPTEVPDWLISGPGRSL